METNRTPSPDASSTDAAVATTTDIVIEPTTEPAPRYALFDGHLPDEVDPLVAPGIEDSFTETRRLRRDGWTPERMRKFLEDFAESGVFLDACRAVGMSARAAYNLRDRDPLFDAGCDAARALARRRLADDLLSRSINGVIDRIYKDGVVVAERHRYDNRLSMAVLNRLDARLDRAEQNGERHLHVMRRWDEFLDAMGEDRREDGQALLAPPESGPESEPAQSASGHELHELHLDGGAQMEMEMDKDLHDVWEDDDGIWWTDYPPPADFDGDEQGDYGDDDYRRRLATDEQAVIDAEQEEDRAADLAQAEAQRDSYFFGVEAEAEPPSDSEPDA
jgi:hypothetical protein